MSELPSQKAQLYRQHCRICGRTCSNSVGICDSPVCSVALVEKLEQQLVEKLEQQLAELESEKARLEARIMTQMLEVEDEATR